MNYLAHAWLSQYNNELLVGNMIGDFVKGKQYQSYPPLVAQGILMHRHIDTFTDEHIINKEAKSYLRNVAGLYAGAFTDIIYDHFLAIQPQYFDAQPLQQFAENIYAIIDTHKLLLPPRFANIFFYMKRDDWLCNYANMEGIQKSFNGLSHRVKNRVNADKIFDAFTKEYDVLQKCFVKFFPLLIDYIHNRRRQCSLNDLQPFI